jgi:hypothetical protein
MPNLGDFLGYLMSEITIARMQSDIEAIRIAELYSSHPLLSSLPVPHFRLPNIDIEVPVVIKQMEEPDNEQVPRGAPLLKEMKEKFDEVLSRFVKDESIELKKETKKRLDLSIEKRIGELSQPKEVAININQVAEGLSDIVSSILSEPGGPVEDSNRQKIRDSLKDISRFEFLKLSKPPRRLQVLVKTSEIKEAGPNDVITRLHLKVNEEAFEWTTTESGGKRKDRLVFE